MLRRPGASRAPRSRQQYRRNVSRTRTSRRRTLWEEGRHPGRLVAHLAAAAALAVLVTDQLATGGVSWLFDVSFVLICVAAGLAVRPPDMFVVAVLPPLLMLASMVALAFADRAAVARATDGAVQAVVSGLAHHAGALFVGYTLTLTVLALRGVALKNAGAIRRQA